MRSIQLTRAWLAALSCSALLAACGGGGESESAPLPTEPVPAEPAPPVVPEPPTPPVAPEPSEPPVAPPEGQAPTASISPVDPLVLVQQDVVLNAGASKGVDGATLSYQWSVLTRPAASKATISKPATARATFLPDAAGAYVVQLIVSDGAASSEPQTVAFRAATAVEGAIAVDTIWRSQQSPIVLTKEVHINSGVSLTVEEGVEVIGRGRGLHVEGTLLVAGTPTNKVTLKDLHVSHPVTGGGYSVHAAHADIQGGSFYSECTSWGCFSILGPPPGGTLKLTDSKLTDTVSPIVLNFSADRSGHSVIARNVFERTAGIEFSSEASLGTDKSLAIVNNVFKNGVDNEDGWNAAIAQIEPGNLDYTITNNSFLSTDRVALRIAPDETNTTDFLAINNYWGTTDTATIESMIFAGGVPVRYQPYLPEPHPDTPVP